MKNNWFNLMCLVKNDYDSEDNHKLILKEKKCMINALKRQWKQYFEPKK